MFRLLAAIVAMSFMAVYAQNVYMPRARSFHASTRNLSPRSTSPSTSEKTTSSSTPGVVIPKVMVVTMFEPERDAWTNNRNISFERFVPIPGLSPLFPYIACTHDYDVCLATLGEGEINAASSMTAILYNSHFNLSQTYFLFNGIAGINPSMGTIGSVGFPQFAVQFGLQYGLDGREVPANWSASFWNYGTSQPNEYPAWFYGTEVFGLNTALRDKILPIVSKVVLNDTKTAMEHRAIFHDSPARDPPAVFQGDVMTSDLYYTGKIFGEMASNLTLTLTNGTGSYALTAQEDNAVLETLVRAHHAGFADFGRAIMYRTASDFDRGTCIFFLMKAPSGMNDYEFFMNMTKISDLAVPALENLYLVGYPIVRAVRSFVLISDHFQLDGLDAHTPGFHEL